MRPCPSDPFHACRAACPSGKPHGPRARRWKPRRWRSGLAQFSGFAAVAVVLPVGVNVKVSGKAPLPWRTASSIGEETGCGCGAFQLYLLAKCRQTRPRVRSALAARRSGTVRARVPGHLRDSPVLPARGRRRYRSARSDRPRRTGRHRARDQRARPGGGNPHAGTGSGGSRRDAAPGGSAATRVPGRCRMSTLTSLARAEAVRAGRAQPIATVRHVHIHDRPLVLIPLALAGEANAPLAAMVGEDPDSPGCWSWPTPATAISASRSPRSSPRRWCPMWTVSRPARWKPSALTVAATSGSGTPTRRRSWYPTRPGSASCACSGAPPGSGGRTATTR